MSRPSPIALSVLLLAFFAAATASATTYYIAANGSDSNNGTSKTTPWLHAPGMTSCSGTCAAANPQAGDRFIFRGGDTWHYGNSRLSPFVGFSNGAWNWTWSGSSGSCQLNPSKGATVTTSCIYIGVDPTWYSGSSWARPVMNMDNPITNGSPSSCAYEDSNYALIINSANYTIWDNFEVTGWCWNVTAPYGNVMSIGTLSEIKNFYFHGWTMGATATGCGSCDSDEYWALGGSYRLGGFLRIDHNVFDGSDSTYGNTSSATGGMILTGAFQIDHNVFVHVSNVVKYDAMILVDDNYIDQMYEPVVGGTHGNVFEWVPDNYTMSTYYFNNMIRRTAEGETIDMYPGSSSSSKYGYIFNNVMTGPNGNSTNCYMIEGDGTGGPGLTQYFNNTSDSPCIIRNLRGNASGAFQNNHFIGYSSSSIGAFCAMTQCIENGHEVFQSESAANTQGYANANNYAPSSAVNATVGAGANLTSTLCAGMDNSVAAAACRSGYAGVTYNLSSHSALDNTPVSRPSSGAWDSGAYQYSASTSSLSPPTGLSATVQ